MKKKTEKMKRGEAKKAKEKQMETFKNKQNVLFRGDNRVFQLKTKKGKGEKRRRV